MRRELGVFLKGKRAALGLRRESVSAAADIGYDWYVRIEQGRARASTHVLRRVAGALDLDRAELDYVLALARGDSAGDRPANGCSGRGEVPHAVLRVLHAQEPAPAYVINTRMDLLAWNGAAVSFYDLDWGTIPKGERNVLWLMLTHPTLRERIVDAAEHARRLVHRCRGLWAGRTDDPAISRLVARYADGSADFRRWWTEPVPVALDLGPIRKAILDAEYGTLTVEQTAWLFGDRSEHILILSSPVDEGGHRTTEGLAGLARRSSSRQAVRIE